MPTAHPTEISALLILAGLVAVPLGYAAVWVGRSRYTLVQSFWYMVCYLLVRILWRAEIVGRLPVGPRQGAIIVCNHMGPFDPAFIQVVAHRVVHWMVAREYYGHPAMAWFFRIVHAIPVSRAGTDTAATKMAIRYAQAGELVGLFPEGRINVTDQLLLPGRPGAALIALKAQVPVIPCYVSASPRGRTILGTLFMPAKTRLVVGSPIDVTRAVGQLPDREKQKALTLLFLREIAKLAGQTEFQPRLAGKRWMPETT